MYDFLLLINTIPLILHRFRDTAFDRSKIAIFGYLSCVWSHPLPRWRGSLHHIIVIPRLHDTTGCQTGCQTGLTTVKPIWQPVVSC